MSSHVWHGVVCGIAVVVIGLAGDSLGADPQVLTDRLHHLRAGEQREWSEFPEQAEGAF